MQDAIPLKGKRSRFGLRIRPLLIALIGLSLAAVAATGVYLLVRGGDEESVRVVTGVQFPYPQGWAEQPLSGDDRNAGLLLKLERGDPAASFLARTVIARLPADFNAQALASDTEAALAAEIDGFDLLSSEVAAVGPYQAVLIEYRQAAAEGQPAYQTLLAILPDENQTFYLTVRAERGDFRQTKDEGLKIIGDFSAYVSAPPN